ncbi:hypothetical protein ETB97_002223 [Aspergillus alliaceus]|uniref:Cystathionine gamma-synthase n=1 Tax=Petromyces alliaceus TaxID=209559 RepID=A0A8H6A4B6_PETAA|nr:hypothetical protein ETB97_002223 [Aspergillus burnettii]
MGICSWGSKQGELGDRKDPMWLSTVRSSLACRSIYETKASGGNNGRFHINKPVKGILEAIRARLKLSDSVKCMVFPSSRAARDCAAVLTEATMDGNDFIECAHFFASPRLNLGSEYAYWARFSAVVYPSDLSNIAMGFWRDFGDGISPRHAAFCLELFDYLDSDSTHPILRTPAPRKHDQPELQREANCFESALSNMFHVKSSIAHHVRPHQLQAAPLTTDDIFIYPTGMAAISAANRALLSLKPKSDVVLYGWLYVETVNVLRRSPWGQKISYHLGRDQDLDELEGALLAGQHITALFCELPNNIKLASFNLRRIWSLAQKYNFVVVCDATVGNLINIDILPLVDILTLSLTKAFSGVSNVTGGGIVLNPSSPRHGQLKDMLASQYEDRYFPLDLATLKHNCVDLAARVHTYNANTLPVVNLLKDHPCIACIYYPSLGPTAHYYESYRRKGGGYGNVLSVIFHSPDSAVVFYDALDVCKGPSIGTNFTLAIPFAWLSQYREKDNLEKYGVPRHIIRLSIGLEDVDQICKTVRRALEKVEQLGHDKQGLPE